MRSSYLVDGHHHPIIIELPIFHLLCNTLKILTQIVYFMIVCTAANTTNRTKPGGRDITHKVLKAAESSLAVIGGGWLGQDGHTAAMVKLVFRRPYFCSDTTFYSETVHYKIRD